MTARIKQPGLLRGGVFFVIGTAFSIGLLTLIRLAYGKDDLMYGEGAVMISLIAAPLFFLVGLGAFDYWFYWASGRPTRPEDHSSHGAHSWKDYFRVNTDHKVIGVQYVVTSFFFMFVGGLLAMLCLLYTSPSPRDS